MKEAALVLFVNSKGQVLLHLKDEDPGVLFSGKWGLLEGSMKDDGQTTGALVRGIMEDNYITNRSFKFLNDYEHHDLKTGHHYKLYVFICVLDLQLLKVVLHEGQKIDYFSLDEIRTLDAPDVVKVIIKDSVLALSPSKN